MTELTAPQQRLYAGVHLGETDPDTHMAAEERVFGFWVFLMSDAVIFALLFAVYETLVGGTAGGPSGADLFKLEPTLVETLILLTSSFTFGMASLVMKFKKDILLLQGILILTLILGLSFLGLELNDFLLLTAQGALPQQSGFLSAFYVLVSTHFLHVLTGCIWILVMVVQLRVFGLDETTKTRLMRLGIFWHFLDIVWILIFTFVYLLGVL